MATSNELLAIKGERENTAALIEQGQASSATCKRYQAELSEAGFPEAKANEMFSTLDKVQSFIGGREENREGSLAASRYEDQSFNAAKDFTAKIRSVGPIALRDHDITNLTARSFDAKEQVKDSTAKMVLYLNQLKPTVTTLQEELKPYFRNESPLPELERLLKALSSADEKQKDLIDLGPTKTVDLNVAKGRLLELIDDMNRIGRIAFPGQAEIIARFNKDILWRARRKKKSTTEKTDEKKPADPS